MRHLLPLVCAVCASTLLPPCPRARADAGPQPSGGTQQPSAGPTEVVTTPQLPPATSPPKQQPAQGPPTASSTDETQPPEPAVLPPPPPLPPRNRIVLNNLLVLRLNPVGLEDQVRFGYQRRLFEAPARPMLRDNFVFVGIAPRFNPAFVKIGPSVEIQPGSIFNLRVGFEYLRFFSTFGFLQSYGSPLDDYNDKLLAACSSKDPAVLGRCSYRDPQGTRIESPTAPRNIAAQGVHLMIEPTLQLRTGPLALRNKLAIEYWAMQTQPGDRAFYDVTLDTLVPKNGWVVTNDLDVVYVTSFRLSVGLRYTVVKALYRASDFRDGEDPGLEDNMLQRMGPMLSYTFFDRGFTRFNKPTLLLITSFYLDHRYRTGQAASAVLPGVFVNSGAMPYIIVGFSFQSDFLKGRPASASASPALR